jgi:hypothetical protein
MGRICCWHRGGKFQRAAVANTDEFLLPAADFAGKAGS